VVVVSVNVIGDYEIHAVGMLRLVCPLVPK
jgi:hypothetical protein